MTTENTGTTTNNDARMSGESGGNGGGGAISADGAVNVDNWSFYARPKTQGPPRSTPYLVGPIVGTVTETTAR